MEAKNYVIKNASKCFEACVDGTVAKQNLTQWGISECVSAVYEKANITKFFEWQCQCLSRSDVLNGNRNFVYSAPTSAGKTLVAEILLLKRVCENGGKGIIVLPYIAVAVEKLKSLKERFSPAGIKVDGYIGSESANWNFLQVAVCTFEKANALVNYLVQQNRIEEVKIIVIDELHMVGDFGRGYLLELLLNKLMVLAKSNNQIKIQIVGMSATLSNLSSIAYWLNADHFSTNFRPTPLTELIRFKNTIFDVQLNEVRKIDNFIGLNATNDISGVILLTLESAMCGKSVLIFCPTRRWCENLCLQISEATKRLTNSQRETFIDKEKLNNVKKLFKLSAAGYDEQSTLSKLLLNGISYHHGSLSSQEREIIEDAFRTGIIKILAATTTLSAGINLPASRVIIRTPVAYDGKSNISALTYQQMCGRAGRKGLTLDNCGESILCVAEFPNNKLKPMFSKTLPAVMSCLDPNLPDNDQAAAVSIRENVTCNFRLSRAVLEIVVTGIAKNIVEVASYVRHTLWATQFCGQPSKHYDTMEHSFSASTHLHGSCGCSSECFVTIASKYLDELERLELLCRSNNQKNQSRSAGACEQTNTSLQANFSTSDHLISTTFGNAIIRSSMTLVDGMRHLQELQSAFQKLNLETYLHLIYLVIPSNPAENRLSDINWDVFHEMFVTNLSEEEKRVASVVGVTREFILRRSRGANSIDGNSLAANHVRFYCALLLLDYNNEMPLNLVSKKYGVNKGLIQTIQQEVIMAAGMLVVFCRELGWKLISSLFSDFQSSLQHGVQKELVDLMRVDGVTGKLAQAFYDQGFESLSMLACANARDIQKILDQTQSFDNRYSEDFSPVLNLCENENIFKFEQTTITALNRSNCVRPNTKESPPKRCVGLKNTIVTCSNHDKALFIIKQAHCILEANMAATGYNIKRLQPDELSDAVGEYCEMENS